MLTEELERSDSLYIEKTVCLETELLRLRIDAVDFAIDRLRETADDAECSWLRKLQKDLMTSKAMFKKVLES